MNASVASLWGASAPRFLVRCLFLTAAFRCRAFAHSAQSQCSFRKLPGILFDNHSLLMLPIPARLPGETRSLEKDYRGRRRSTSMQEDMHSC